MYPLLQIKNLQIDFLTETGYVTAVRNINITIHRNEILGIAGESGSGKSVIVMSILKLLPESITRFPSGEILFSSDGINRVDILTLHESELNKIRGKEMAMIFQEPMTSLNPLFTCGSQVMESILLHNKISRQEAYKQTIDLLQKVKLSASEEIFSRYPHQLSGGQKQRVMIAIAISSRPSLLICDEPTTALDVTVQKNVLDLIKELQLVTEMAVIFITHDLAVISRMADRIIILLKGKIIEEAKTSVLFSQPQNNYTQQLISIYKKIAGASSTQNANSETNTITPFISVSGLSVSFPSHKNILGKPTRFNKAIDDISFDIIKGETLGIVGESGSGKTTLGRTLLKLITPQKGIIRFNGKLLPEVNSKDFLPYRKKMQIVFQDPYSSLNPSITIGSAIGEPLLVHEPTLTETKRQQRVMDMLEKVGLNSSHYNRYPHEFSGGQRQRIVISRALILNPEFLICDESVAALDISIQAQILSLLRSLKTEFGFTCLFISHDLSVVKHISDRIMVMKSGKIEEIGDASQVYHHPRSAYTQQLLAAIPLLKSNG